MKRRDFLKLGALSAASLQAKELDGAAQALFDKQSGLSANKFGPFYVRTIAGRVVETEPFEGDACPNELNNALLDHIQNESRVKFPFVRKSFWLTQTTQSQSFVAKRSLCALAGMRR